MCIRSNSRLVVPQVRSLEIWRGQRRCAFGVVPALIHCGRLTADAAVADATEMACSLLPEDRVIVRRRRRRHR
jgi:hypothetical protein